MKKGLLLWLLSGFLIMVGIFLVVWYKSSPGTSTTSVQPTTPSPSIVEMMETAEDKLVEGMPEIPVYPDAVVEESFKRTIGEHTEYYVVWEADASVAQIISFYETKLPLDGWTITELPEAREEVGEEGMAATKNNMNLIINLERQTTADPTEILVDVFVKNE